MLGMIYRIYRLFSITGSHPRAMLCREPCRWPLRGILQRWRAVQRLGLHLASESTPPRFAPVPRTAAPHRQSEAARAVVLSVNDTWKLWYNERFGSTSTGTVCLLCSRIRYIEVRLTGPDCTGGLHNWLLFRSYVIRLGIRARANPFSRAGARARRMPALVRGWLLFSARTADKQKSM